jgi:hypothetical protein
MTSFASRIVVTVIFAAMLVACAIGRSGNPSCESKEEYQAAQTSALLSVPAGLDPPDDSSHLNVPDDPKPVEPLSRNAACLQRPPNYFDKPLTGPGD